MARAKAKVKVLENNIVTLQSLQEQYDLGFFGVCGGDAHTDFPDQPASFIL